MDLKALVGNFVSEDGSIHLPEQLTLATLSELVYQSDVAQGGGNRHAMCAWDFTGPGEPTKRNFTRSQINVRIKAVAARLQQIAQPGDRVALMAGNSPEYLFGFLGAMYAGTIPVPLYDPNEPGHGDHLRAVIDDCQAKVVLTDKRSAGGVRRFFAELPGADRPRILAIDALPDALADSWTAPKPESGVLNINNTAFLQYTSGSTRRPAGVILTSKSILTNVLQIFMAGQLSFPLRLVNWLPLHHDMGIIMASFVVILGLPMDLFSPREFVQHPKRWTDLMARRGDDDGDTYAFLPNFALELTARYGRPDEGQDFSNVAGLIIGSEPVQESALESFAAAFTPYGLKRAALRPSYGLAEASLLVTTPQTPNRPVISYFDREQLAAGKATVVKHNSAHALAVASNGQGVWGSSLTVVDPQTHDEVADGVVGELWINGDNLAQGYLDRPEDTAATFNQTLGARLEEGSRAEGYPDEGWLATGDLGVILDGETYITGRLKDMIVIAGRNHYPQDIEATVQEASPHVRADSVAAFAIPGEDVERLVIMAERADDADSTGDSDAVSAIKAAVAQIHGVTPYDIQIVAPLEIRRSASGKIARRVNQQNYLRELENNG